MVEANEDPLAVTMKIRRETRAAEERAQAERAFAAAGGLQAPPQPAASVPGRLASQAQAHVAVPDRQPERHPVDAETAFRRARLGLVAALALALLLVWIAQRRKAGA